ncbi:MULTISPECIES: TonB-dependent siderophore receptor [unclassified Duganella]|uniref:TonB-dependent receptor n=1 Tax=unclassified Duganella TaxID=2636909 RepID=UPI00088387ED|nr:MULTISPECIES: TonB-dependent receptor plug domain-containing protein [unclassified Duganella]SDF42879.1 TonB-dependent Receptor Plug Domain [Duganella sp. OV458]SDI83667.1 TonB-dependent Receptor Plug Domain [Duganella sp. OV510]
MNHQLPQPTPRRLALAVALALTALQAQADPAAAAVADDAAAPAVEAIADGSVVVVKGQSTALARRPVSSVYGTDTSLLDTPRSVSQVNADQLLRDGIKTADDLVKYAPGVTRNGGQNVSVAPLIRGQASELYQDGQRTYNVRHPFNTNAFEGVDIVAGPVPQVFGISSRSGGYANYLSKKPDFESQHGQVSAQLGTWVPGGGSYGANSLTFDLTGPLSETLAYRVSVTPQRAKDYADGVSNNYNAFYGALAWKPAAGVRVDWNLAVDDYYDFNVTHGWNRVTQTLIDSGQYYGGRATPIISVGSGASIKYYSPVYASGAYNSSVVGWQQRTAVTNTAGVKQYVAGALLSGTALPSFLTNAATPGTVRGWVYDPGLQGNGLTSLSDSAYSNPNDKNTARRETSQLRVAWDITRGWSLLNSALYQHSKDTGSSVGSFFTQIEDRIFEDRLELRGNGGYTLFGLPLRHDSNTGVSYRYERFSTKAANNSFTINPYDLTAPLDLKTPGTLLGLASPSGPGSWIGTAGVPQYSSAFGYLSLPAAYPAGGDFYSERGGSPAAGGAVYTSDGDWKNLGLFTQQNFLLDERYGLNLGLSGTRVDAYIHNPVYLTAAQEVSDSLRAYLPAVQGSLLYKPTADSTLYATYDRSYSINTGGFADVLTWGANNKLNPLNFRSLSRLFEVGAKAELIPGRLQGTIAAYRQQRDVAPLTDGSVPKMQIRGVDLSLRLQATRDVTAGLNYSLINAKYTYITFPAGFFSPYGFVADNATVFADGNTLNQRAAPGSSKAPGIPQHSLNGYVDVRFGKGFGAEASAWWTSKWDTSLAHNATVPNEHNLNLTLYYRQPKWDAALRILNVTNEQNFVNGLTGATTEFLQPGVPRALQASLAYRF